MEKEEKIDEVEISDHILRGFMVYGYGQEGTVLRQIANLQQE